MNHQVFLIADRADRALKLAYEAMSFNGLPVAFVSERQVREGDLTRFLAVILPSLRHAPEDVAGAVTEYADAGGTLWVIGDPSEALARDEYAGPRKTSLPGKAIRAWPETTSPSELRDALLRAFVDAGIQRPVVLQAENGVEPWAIDYRSVRDGNG